MNVTVSHVISFRLRSTLTLTVMVSLMISFLLRFTLTLTVMVSLMIGPYRKCLQKSPPKRDI